MQQVRRILVPVDFGDCSRAALEYALFLAKSFDASIDVLHVWSVPSYVGPSLAVSLGQGRDDILEEAARREAETKLISFLDTIDRPDTVPFKRHVTYGAPHEVISGIAEDYDLIVMGTHGRTGISHLIMGSVAERVLRAAACPVVVVNEKSARADILGKVEQQETPRA